MDLTGRLGLLGTLKIELDYYRQHKNIYWHKKMAKSVYWERLLSSPKRLHWLFHMKKQLRFVTTLPFFQAVRSVLAKPTATEETEFEAAEQAIKQLVSKAVVSEGVVDIFTAAGLEKPDVSILSDAFLAEVRDLPHKNVAVELLEKLLNDEIGTRSEKNVVQGRSFASMLERSIRTYQNRTIEAAQVIEQLIDIVIHLTNRKRLLKLSWSRQRHWARIGQRRKLGTIHFEV